MHLVWYAIVGLIAGALAKALSPGSKGEPTGCLMTMVVGIAGSLLVGFVLHDVLKWQTGGGFIGSICGATIGAFVLMWGFAKFQK